MPTTDVINDGDTMFVEDLVTHSQVLSLRASHVPRTACDGKMTPRFETDRISVLRCEACGDVLVRNARFVVVWVEHHS